MNNLAQTLKPDFIQKHNERRASRSKAVITDPELAHRIPRLTRLMSLAIRFDQLIRRGSVADYAELAELGHITRARMTQIMNLLLLAPDIQEAILALPTIKSGRAPLQERHIRHIVKVVNWDRQRTLWRKIFNNRVLTRDSVV